MAVLEKRIRPKIRGQPMMSRRKKVWFLVPMTGRSSHGGRVKKKRHEYFKYDVRIEQGREEVV